MIIFEHFKFKVAKIEFKVPKISGKDRKIVRNFGEYWNFVLLRIFQPWYIHRYIIMYDTYILYMKDDITMILLWQTYDIPKLIQ